MSVVKRLVITGRVQGVGFRFHTSRVARELGVTGWVRNRGDGSVEALVAGAPEAVDKMIEWARHGPRSASVARIEIFDADGCFASFDTLPTQLQGE